MNPQGVRFKMFPWGELRRKGVESLSKSLLITLALFLWGQGQGPGLPQVTFPAADINKHISTIDGPNGNNLGAMYRGYMMIIFSPDGMAPGGGLNFWDMSDPYKPNLVSTTIPNSAEAEFVEVHGYGFSGDVAAFQSHKGIMFWDLSDIRNPKLLKNLILSALPGNGYEGGNFATFWQAPYAYTASSDYGIHIVDGTDPANPKELKRLPKDEIGNFRVGHTYAIGNLLLASTVGTGSGDVGMALFDIGDPDTPKMLFTTKAFPASYSMLINGEKIYGSGNDGKVHVIDISNFEAPTLEASTPVISTTHGEYIFIQDEFLFSGFDNVWKKLDLSDNLKVVGEGALNNGGQEGHPQPYGNWIMVGNDHGEGSGIFPHTTAPDTKGPSANMVNPRDKATLQAITSRVGLTFTDQIDVPSVNAQTFIVREKGGAVLTGTYSSQQAIINFWPDAPLKYDTEYEVLLPKGGIKDWSGNGLETQHLSTFRTVPENYVPPEPPKPVWVSNSGISVTATSENDGFPASNIIDGDPNTIWHSQFQPSVAAPPFDLIFQFNQPTGIQGLSYTQRSGGGNGTISQYELAVSTDGVNYTNVSTGNFLQIVSFDSVQVTHVRLRVLQGTGGFGSGAEIKFLSHMTPGVNPVVSRKLDGILNRENNLRPGLYNFQGKLLFSEEVMDKVSIPRGLYLHITPQGKRVLKSII